ncbi:MAG: hypothetical protein KY475_06930 [Planctomycetes bacterium]|nr:hypothetical protein [Planctomycetota bacterium]
MSVSAKRMAGIRKAAHENAELKRLYWRSFWIRFSAGMIGWLLMRFTSLQLVADAQHYDEVAASIARDWLSGRSSAWLEAHGHQPFQPVAILVFIACFYVLTLGFRALPLLIAGYCAVTSLVPGWTYRVARELGASSRAAMFSAWLVAFCPAFVFWSAALYKEGIILLIINVAFYHALRVQSTRNAQSLIVLALCLALLLGLRLYLAPLLGFSCLLGLMMHRKFRRSGLGPREIARQMVVVGGFLVIMVVSVSSAMLSQQDPFGSESVSRSDRASEAIPMSIEEAVHKISLSRRDLASTPSGYWPHIEYESLEDLLKFMPMGMVLFLVLPLPWHIGSFRQNLGIPDTALWVFVLYPLAAVGIWRMLRRDLPATLIFLLGAAVLCCLYGVFIGNIGAAYRMRVQVWLLLAPFVGVGWEALFAGAPAVSAGARRRRIPSLGSRPSNEQRPRQPEVPIS